MKPLLFIRRHWARTWIHETWIEFFPSLDGKIISDISYIGSSSIYVNHVSFHGHIDNIGDRAFNPDFHQRNISSAKRFGIQFETVFMDTAHVCPHCGRVTVVDWTEYEKDPRSEHWKALSNIALLNRNNGFNTPLTFEQLAIFQAIYGIYRNTQSFFYRRCNSCSQQKRNLIQSLQAPAYNSQIHANRYFANRTDSPYVLFASTIKSDKDRAAWWETKLICHGRSVAKTPARSIKKAIERRLRRKHLTIAEHKALSMMLAPSIIKQRLKSA